MLIVIALNVITLSVLLPNVKILSYSMNSIIRRNVIMQNVMAPPNKYMKNDYEVFKKASLGCKAKNQASPLK
jgi:hypothetical protein